MNGAADLGGMMGFGPVVPEPEDERFHAEWERRILALVLAMGAARRWSIDAGRFARESLPPPVYLNSSYYAIWTLGLERLLVATGLVGEAELAEGRAREPGADVRAWSPDDARAAFAAGSPYTRPAPGPPVRGRRHRAHPRAAPHRAHPAAPLRPRQAGTVERVHGAHVLPDSNAHGRGERPEWLYSVRFIGRELWGEAADPTLDRRPSTPGKATSGA